MHPSHWSPKSGMSMSEKLRQRRIIGVPAQNKNNKEISKHKNDNKASKTIDNVNKQWLK